MYTLYIIQYLYKDYTRIYRIKEDKKLRKQGAILQKEEGKHCPKWLAAGKKPARTKRQGKKKQSDRSQIEKKGACKPMDTGDKLFFNAKDREKISRKETKKSGKIVDSVQILPGEMLDNVNRIRDTLNALKVPNKTRGRAKYPWGYSDTLTVLAEYGAAKMLLEPDFQRLEREAETARRAEKKEATIIDSIMGNGLF